MKTSLFIRLRQWKILYPKPSWTCFVLISIYVIDIIWIVTQVFIIFMRLSPICQNEPSNRHDELNNCMLILKMWWINLLVYSNFQRKQGKHCNNIIYLEFLAKNKLQINIRSIQWILRSNKYLYVVSTINLHIFQNSVCIQNICLDFKFFFKAYIHAPQSRFCKFTPNHSNTHTNIQSITFVWVYSILVQKCIVHRLNSHVSFVHSYSVEIDGCPKCTTYVQIVYASEQEMFPNGRTKNWKR